MDSSSVLRQQTQNKIRSNFQRMNNEQNKKRTPSTHLSNKAAECVQKPPLQPGISRLPVLAKTLRLQTSSEFKQSHIKWEEKPLAGKTKKRQSTRSVPFNLSRSNRAKRAVEIHKPLTAPHSKTHANQPETSACNEKPSKPQVVLNSKGNSARGVGKCQGKATENASQLSGQSGSSNPLKTSATFNNALSSVPGKLVQNGGSSARSAQPVSGAEAALNNLNLLSLKEPSKSSDAGLLTTPGSSSKALNDKEENFQPDHAALLRVLRNEGVTPQSKPYNNFPQRVSVMKSQRKAEPTAGPVRLVQFSPDSAALQSILQNEGVKAGGPLGAAFRDSVCPSKRGTSIYTAQRVPVKKRNAEAAGGSVAALKETPLMKWTPQRVRNTKHQPMSAVVCTSAFILSALWVLCSRRLMSSCCFRFQKWYQTPYGTPGHRSCKANLQSRQEEVVQRLFDDPEDEQSTAESDTDPRTQTEQFPDQASAKNLSSKEPVESSRIKSEDDNEEEEQKTSLPAQPRESVIFFSTSKKLIRAPYFDPKVSAQQNQLGPVSTDQRNLSGAQNETSSESESAHHSSHSVLRLRRDLTTQKTSSLSSAVLMLRKRFPPLEELRLDDEVSTYTSKSVTAAPGFLPPRPRCGNPLASFLHFEESTRFVPIGLDLPPASHNSPMHKR
ncbi:uncharacterized protein LOC108244564 isoform X2 [Kryptolebias marmoratus]|uniref:uncharacterized protein LOC108244564 isoform X2 n=1 Tax=Kryptolebias marmoratus TaxID=37003 RepID=UPI0018AC93E6|nr:uncharacterized protein LOC108244564 isoform X2 [Kryptolebias marmoratus]